MKKGLCTVIFIFISLAASSAAYSGVVDKVIAVVNDEVITKSELDIMVLPVYRKYASRYQGQELMDKVNEAAEKLLDRLIEETLILEEARRQKIKVEESEIDERVERIRRKFEGREDFEEALKANRISMEKLREEYSQQAMVEKMIDMKVRAKISVGPSEIQNYYNEHLSEFHKPESIELWSIFIKKDKDSNNSEKLRLTGQLLRNLKTGADFGELARAHSSAANAASGGYMGYVHRGELLAKIEDKIFGLKNGQLSEMVSVPSGYYIFKAGEHKAAATVSLEEATSRITSILYNRKFEKRYREWIDGLKKDAYISIR